MRRLLLLPLAAAAALSAADTSPGQQPPAAAGQPTTITLPPGVTLPPGLAERLGGLTTGDKKFEDFDTVVKGAKEHDGLFKLHQKDDHVYAEIRQDQFDRPLLAPIAIARGLGQGGHTLNFDEQWVLSFRRVGDRVHVIRRNVHFTARPGTPAAKAVETTYTDSVLLALPIKAVNPMRMSVLVDLNQIFLTDFANLGLGMLDPSRSTWAKVKAYPKNIELQVAATFSGFGGRGRSIAGLGNDAVIDPRGTTVVIHYGLVQLPEYGYQPRVADDRVGHFVTVVRDYSTDTKDTSFVRYVNRWRLERADGFPPNKLAPPKKKIVFWIEKSVPEEYRAYVRDGILEWNKAFEKVGYRDAIEVRQQENEDFDPEDINYATFRWITTNGAFAMGPSRVNPMTGEILDADIIFDADLVRTWKQEAGLFGGKAALDEPASLVRAAKKGDFLRDALSWNDRAGDEPGERLVNQYRAVQQGMCQCGACLKSQLGLAAMSLAALAPADARASQAEKDRASEELIGQAIKYVTMHEVGHTLGLRHNFKASTMLRADQLNDTSLTHKQGLIGSVMDYAAVNLAPKGVKQGDYFTTTLGPYDYWAIEYAYKPLGGSFTGSHPANPLAAGALGGGPLGGAFISGMSFGGGSEAELKKIAARAAEPGLAYATDEDLYGGSDPLVHAWDLGADPLQFAQDRVKLAEDLFKDLADRVVEQGEGYQRARQAFGVLLKQYGDAAELASEFVAGESMYRDHRGDPNARDPFVPVPADKQRAALRFVQDQILTDAPFKFPPELLRKLAADRWVHWGNERVMFGGVEFPVYERVLAIQRVVLDQLLDPKTLARVQNSALKAGKDDKAVTIAEVFRTLTDGVWMDLPGGAGQPEDKRPATSVARRNLQREHLKDLTQLVLGRRPSAGRTDILVLLGLGGAGGEAVPPDARSLARMHLREIGGRIDKALAPSAPPADDTTRAHLEECKERIAKALAASMQVND